MNTESIFQSGLSGSKTTGNMFKLQLRVEMDTGKEL